MSDEQPQTQPQPSAAIVPVAVRATLDTTPHQASLVSPFSNDLAFTAAQRMAKALAASSLVPAAYRENLPNCLIAMEMASRIGVSVLAAMQNLDVIQGKPSWSAKFLIATVNASGRFTPLRFEWSGSPGKDDWGCRARAKDKSSDELCEGPWVTWVMATKEGWTTKNGSKWKTMSELMFCYRAAAFWTRLYCPELSIGFQTSEEVHDTYGETVTSPSAQMPAQLSPAGAKALEAVIGLQADAAQVVNAEEPATVAEPEKRTGKKAEQVTFDKETGEVKS